MKVDITERFRLDIPGSNVTYLFLQPRGYNLPDHIARQIIEQGCGERVYRSYDIIDLEKDMAA